MTLLLTHEKTEIHSNLKVLSKYLSVRVFVSPRLSVSVAGLSVVGEIATQRTCHLLERQVSGTYYDVENLPTFRSLSLCLCKTEEDPVPC